jgi:TrmH family RNA methyltransferase
MDLIKSRSNQKVKLARSLRLRKSRNESGLFLVEGIRHTGEAYQSGAAIQFILFSPDLLRSKFALNLIDQASKSGIICYPTTTEVFISIAEKDHPQGICAVVRQPDLSLSRLAPHNFPWGAAVTSPQDPGNIGTILRSIDAVGAAGLILIDSSADPFHPTGVRASMGMVFWYSIAVCSFNDFAIWVKKHRYSVFGSSAQCGINIQETANFKLPLILLLGSEREGLRDKHKAICKEVLSLPMEGMASSLNLGVAAGIMLYQIRDKLSRKRKH